MAPSKRPTRRKAPAKTPATRTRAASKAAKAAPAPRKAGKRKAAKAPARKAGKRKPAKRPRGKGRTKFTAARRKAILGHLKAGRFRYTAANLAGIGERTLKEWIARGRAQIEAAELADLEGAPVPALDEFGSFAAAVAEAEALAENDAIGVVVDIATGGDHEARDRLKAATWYLERKYPRRYGSAATRVEVTGKDGGALEVDARDLLLERLSKMAARGDGSDD